MNALRARQFALPKGVDGPRERAAAHRVDVVVSERRDLELVELDRRVGGDGDRRRRVHRERPAAVQCNTFAGWMGVVRQSTRPEVNCGRPRCPFETAKSTQPPVQNEIAGSSVRFQFAWASSTRPTAFQWPGVGTRLNDGRVAAGRLGVFGFRLAWGHWARRGPDRGATSRRREQKAAAKQRSCRDSSGVFRARECARPGRHQPGGRDLSRPREKRA